MTFALVLALIVAALAVLHTLGVIYYEITIGDVLDAMKAVKVANAELEEDLMDLLTKVRTRPRTLVLGLFTAGLLYRGFRFSNAWGFLQGFEMLTRSLSDEERAAVLHELERRLSASA